MFASASHPLRVKPVKIGDVEGVEGTTKLGCEGQLFLVALPGRTGFQHRNHADVAGSPSRDQSVSMASSSK
jgi:hypothetical protein